MNNYYNEMLPTYCAGGNFHASNGSHNGYPLLLHHIVSLINSNCSAKAAAGPYVDQMSRNFTKSPTYDYDLCPYHYNLYCQRFMRGLQLCPYEINTLQMQTRGQSENDLWWKERRIRLTASSFGRVVHLQNKTYRGRLVNDLLNGGFSNNATKYGAFSEQKAIDAYKSYTKQNVEPCGFFVHPQFGYLGASPDGLVGHDGLVEVKCPISAKRRYLRKVNCGGDWELKLNHEYFYQIQGQLEVTGREWCDFVVWTPEVGIEHIERIYRDKGEWDLMFPKLKKFYRLSLLPELVNPRIPRGLPIREPNFVLKRK